MKGLIGVLVLGGLLGGVSWAETIPDSWKACERFAVKQYQEWSPGKRVALMLSPVGFEEDKFEDKVGSQFVSTVISGSCQLKVDDEQEVTAPCL